MKIELEATENIQTYELKIGDACLEGIITNRTNDSAFIYETNDYPCYLCADELRAIAEKLDELNSK